MTDEEIVARALYARRFPDAPVAEHFGWYDNGKHDPESCVHYSNVGTAYKDAGASLTALSSAGRLVGDVRYGDTSLATCPRCHQAMIRSLICKPDAWHECPALASAPHPAPDATDWKARCEAVEEWNRLRAQDIVTLGHLAGQAERLRELLSQTVPFIRSAACDDDDHFVVEQREDLLHEVLAALSPPPLSPEKP